MTISVRLSDKDTELVKAYAEMNNISSSDLVRHAVLEKIEDEYIGAWQALCLPAPKNWRKNERCKYG